jgi:hypothetical protein
VVDHALDDSAPVAASIPTEKSAPVTSAQGTAFDAKGKGPEIGEYVLLRGEEHARELVDDAHAAHGVLAFDDIIEPD